MASSSSSFSLFALDRAIDALYDGLPWPKELGRVAFVTHVKKGHGDLAAAAKAIHVMQRLAPKIAVTWIVAGSVTETLDGSLENVARKFFPEKSVVIKHSTFESQSSATAEEVDFGIMGPAKEDFYMLCDGHISLPHSKGREFGFVENGFSTLPSPSPFIKSLQEKGEAGLMWQEVYPRLFDHYFHLQGEHSHSSPSLFSMGLQEGSGLLLEPKLYTAELPLGGYAAPHQLLEIEDERLRDQILKALEGDLDYRTHSFNSGYSWHFNKRDLFVEIVAMQMRLHEPEKDAVFVFNQTHVGTPLTFDGLLSNFTFLHEQGFSTIEIVDRENSIIIGGGLGRKITLIYSLFIQPADMQRIQLASERLLATGDNTAAEAFAARCKLYLYEALPHKEVFLNQQMKIAETISPELADLLKAFNSKYLSLYGGMVSRMSQDAPGNEEAREIIRRVVMSPTLGQETLALCNTVIQKHSFEPILRNALLRTAYRSLYPGLASIERDSLDEEVKEAFVRAIVTGSYETRFAVSSLPLMKERIIEAMKLECV